MSPNLVNLAQKRLRTVGEFLPPPPKFLALGDTASLTAWTLYNRQQTNFGTCYVVARAYSLEQQNVGRAHAELCHASSCLSVYIVCYSITHSFSELQRISGDKSIKKDVVCSVYAIVVVVVD